jgi:hypothetical protein
MTKIIAFFIITLLTRLYVKVNTNVETLGHIISLKEHLHDHIFPSNVFKLYLYSSFKNTFDRINMSIKKNQ